MKAGDTFRLAGAADRHTWVIVSDPDQDPARVLCVSFTSYDAGKDPTCVVEPAELTILDHRSCIYYRDVKVASVAALAAGCDKGLIQKRAPVPPGLLKRIRDGFSTTKDVEFKHIEFLLGQGVIE